MSTVTNPRGKLPARVYWIRRAVVVLVPLLVIWLIAQLAFGGDDAAPRAADTAAKTSAQTKPAESDAPARTKATRGKTTKAGSAGKATSGKAKTKAKAKPKKPPLAQPTGACTPADVSVRPVMESAYAGRHNQITLRFTGTQPACTFELSPSSVAVKITSGSDRIWSTQDCRRAIPRQSVVVRSAVASTATVKWSGRRSGEGECGDEFAWAKPGYYHVAAAAIGATPLDVQFKMTLAPRETITKTVSPDPKQKKNR